jgi:4-carboxymuconolactone decarboxylase
MLLRFERVSAFTKLTVLGLCLLVMGAPRSVAQTTKAVSPAVSKTNAEQELINLSKQKWDWMSERNVDALSSLFDEQAVFVHMGATMSKSQELDVIKSGAIQYKKADIQETSVRFFGSTAIVLNRMWLLAVVGGNEVTNPFIVTGAYAQEGGVRKLASLSFTRLLTPEAGH